MRYSLYVASAADEQRAAFSWLLADHEAVRARGVYLSHGERRLDGNYCGHVALQRALREAARQEGVIQLHVLLDETVADAIGYELLDVTAALYPSLCQTTRRVMRRFDLCELAAFKRDEDATPHEIAALDDAVDALEQARSISGRLRLWAGVLLNPTKIIR
ncbi:hypothetical protein [Paenibacillus ehimensis]|uniref:Uncharacterized protein n=1 Tax=Paenibacillus ehimensis TaxID=79264 RepID=A0ABT8VMK2_9BACL|nr:hypothetical protein [Paenibacillus ehimensis]MDO3682209.1 hypothetical protein [Paenibacillus ehimensis]